MNEVQVFPAPVLPATFVADSKWERERLAFLRLKPAMMQSHANLYVAIHEERAVDSDADPTQLGMRVYAKYGYIPIFVGLVSGEQSVARIPSPRLVS
jgi:hypothetical protein